MYNRPYYVCPFMAQSIGQTGMPDMQQPTVQQMVPMTSPEIPSTPLYQSPGIHFPPSATELPEAVSPAASDPPPILSDNPAVAAITLFKELTGYPNYGNPSGNADILYTGNRGVWTFEIPAFLFIPGNLRGQIIIRAVLDDHYNVPVNRYSARITVNGAVVHTGQVPLVHGQPAGGRFVNWRLLTFNITDLRRNNRVVIVNTSNAGADDWIAFDWMELRLTPRR